MKHFKPVHIFVSFITIILMQLILQTPASGDTRKRDEIVIAMCNPQVSQIKNIEQMI